MGETVQPLMFFANVTPKQTIAHLENCCKCKMDKILVTLSSRICVSFSDSFN